MSNPSREGKTFFEQSQDFKYRNRVLESCALKHKAPETRQKPSKYYNIYYELVPSHKTHYKLLCSLILLDSRDSESWHLVEIRSNEILQFSSSISSMPNLKYI